MLFFNMKKTLATLLLAGNLVAPALFLGKEPENLNDKNTGYGASGAITENAAPISPAALPTSKKDSLIDLVSLSVVFPRPLISFSDWASPFLRAAVSAVMRATNSAKTSLMMNYKYPYFRNDW